MPQEKRLQHYKKLLDQNAAATYGDFNWILDCGVGKCFIAVFLVLAWEDLLGWRMISLKVCF